MLRADTTGLTGQFVLAARRLRRAPVFALAAALLLGVGVGLGIPFFNTINVLLLKSGANTDHYARVVVNDWSGYAIQPSEVALVRVAPPSSFVALVGSGFSQTTAVVDGVSLRVNVEGVAGPYFAEFPTVPVSGRLLVPDDEDLQRDVAVISERLWRVAFGARPDVVGTTAVVGGRRLEVVGVLPAGYAGAPLFRNRIVRDAWVPAHIVAPRELFGRLRPGVSLEQADAELASRQRPPHPSGSARVLGVHRGLGLELGSLHTSIREYTTILLMLVIGTAISLIAAGSFSLLLFARLLSSQADLSIRLALGARARDLIRLLAIEAGLLAAVATLVALGVGVMLTRLFFAQLAGAGGPAFIPALEIDWRLIGYTVATTFGAAAMVVARLAWNLRSLEALGSMVVTSGVGGATQRTAGETSRLVIAQTAVATMLLLVAAMLVRTVIAAEAPDVGVDPDRSVVTWMDTTALPDGAEQAAAAIRRAVDVTQQVPGVADAAAITLLPGGNTGWFSVSTGSSGPRLSARTHYVTASAFATLQRPIQRGRTFTADEDRSGALVAVVSTTAAARLWPDLDPLSRRLWIPKDDGTREAFVVVGVADDAPMSELERRGPRDEARDVYLPLVHRRPGWRPVGILARSHDDGSRLAERIRGAYRLQLPETGLLSVRSVREELDTRLEGAAFSARAYSVIGGLVFIVAMGGLYGLSAHLAALRRREIGIRRALGATPVMLCRMLHTEHRRMLGLGVGIGTLAGIFLASLILRWFPTLDLWDPWSLIVVASTLYAAGLAGALLPFVRAMRDTTIALRVP